MMTTGDEVVVSTGGAVKGDGEDGVLEELVGRAVAQCSAMLAKSNNFSIALKRAWCWGRGILIRWRFDIFRFVDSRFCAFRFLFRFSRFIN